MTITDTTEQQREYPTAFKPKDPRAVEAGRKSQRIQRERREAQRAAEAELEQLKERFLALDLKDEELPETARACIALIIKRVAIGEIPIRNGSEATELLEQLAKVAGRDGASTPAPPTAQTAENERRATLEQVRTGGVTDSQGSVTQQVKGPPPSPETGTPPPA